MKIKFYRNIIFFIVFLTLMINPCYSSNDKTGTTGGAFLKLPGGVRPASMGNAFVAIADDINAIYWNPSGLVQIDSFVFSSMYATWLADISYTTISIARPFNKSTIALSLNYMTIGGIEETTIAQPAGTGRIFSPSNYILTASYARKLMPWLALGINAKLLNENIDDNSTSGYSADLGLLWLIRENLSLGFTAKNSLGSLGNNPLPSNFGLGLSYQLSSLLLALDLNIPNDNQSTFNLGAEYNFRNILFGRIGFNTSSEENAGGAFGLGLGIKRGTMQFDYGYIPYGDLGVTHRFSLSWQPFGITKN